LFRRRFDQVRRKKPDQIDFSMQMEPGEPPLRGGIRSCFSVTLGVFYAALLIAVLASTWLLSA